MNTLHVNIYSNKLFEIVMFHTSAVFTVCLIKYDLFQKHCCNACWDCLGLESIMKSHLSLHQEEYPCCLNVVYLLKQSFSLCAELYKLSMLSSKERVRVRSVNTCFV